MARAQTTAVQDRLVLPLAELKTLLGITDSGSDGKLEMLLEAAKHAADAYLNNPFENDDGAEIAIPDTVRAGVVAWVDSRRTVVGSGRDPDVIRERVGQIEREYRTGGTTGTAVSGAQASDFYSFYWDSHRFEPL